MILNVEPHKSHMNIEFEGKRKEYFDYSNFVSWFILHMYRINESKETVVLSQRGAYCIAIPEKKADLEYFSYEKCVCWYELYTREGKLYLMPRVIKD